MKKYLYLVIIIVLALSNTAYARTNHLPKLIEVKNFKMLNYTNINLYLVNFTVENEYKAEASLNTSGDVKIEKGNKNEYSMELKLSVGSNFVNIRAIKDGQVFEEANMVILYDSTPPEIIIESNKSLYDSTNIKVFGYIEPDCLLKVDNKEIEYSSIYFETDVGLEKAPSKKNIIISLQDVYGNIAKKNVLVTNIHRKYVEMKIYNIKADVEGKEYILKMAPEIIGGSTMIAIRDISNIFGCQIGYDEPTKAITVKHKGVELKMQIGSPIIFVNGKEEIIHNPPMIRGNGITAVPFRIVEKFGFNVFFNSENKSIRVEEDIYP